jgi:serine/threonine protein kinase
MISGLGHYRIIRKLGEGGMGTVYEAHDERLYRTVAIKTLRAGAEGGDARQRLWREARSLARISHPNICQIYDAEQEGDTLFLVLELLQGETLAQRLNAGALAVAEALDIECQILQALEELHRLSIVHRDLKPSNVFLTPHGVKLLDFGVARAVAVRGNTEETASLLTGAGMIVGTPHYMAPEQARATECGPAADIFSAGCVLYEMLAGAKLFAGNTAVDVLHKVMHHQPPLLAGAPEIEVVNDVLRRALAKDPGDRWPSAETMRAALEGARPAAAQTTRVAALAITRLIALPFRMLRKDDQTEFLAYSLPDAIANSLARFDSLVVRSSLIAARFEGQSDPARIGAEAQVDAILTGSLLQTGTQLRVTCQLVGAPSGAVLWSYTADASLQDLFALQDALANRIVESLLPPLTERERHHSRRDVPRSAIAFEYFLRANEVTRSRGLGNMRLARDLYRQCLADDPEYAPAWAGLGRVLRFIYKFGEDPGETLESADAAFRRAFALNPDLALAHNLYTPTECDMGRAADAMVRLLKRARSRLYDAELYAGLVQACRYCGDLEASVVAHSHARKLDPHVATSVAHTYFLLGDYEQSVEFYPRGTGYYLDSAALACCGREAEALVRLDERESGGGATGAVRAIMRSLRAYLKGDAAECLKFIDAGEALTRRDPEVLFYMARHLARIGAADRALATLNAALESGFLCTFQMEHDPWLEPVRAATGYPDLLGKARQRQAKVHATFVASGGEEILSAEGMPAARR